MKHRNAFKADVLVWKRGGNGYASETPLKRFQAVSLMFETFPMKFPSRFWISKKFPSYQPPNDDVKMWDVGGDAFDSMEDVGFLEFADLSLDEPEFENDLIIDN
ncbi:hypothetical protein Tco_0870348 [Tanacetum coccineum]